MNVLRLNSKGGIFLAVCKINNTVMKKLSYSMIMQSDQKIKKKAKIVSTDYDKGMHKKSLWVIEIKKLPSASIISIEISHDCRCNEILNSEEMTGK